MWKLFNADGKLVKVGDKLTSFRGETDIVIEGIGQPPHKPSSTGKVWTDRGNFYPSVFKCEWVEVSHDS